LKPIESKPYSRQIQAYMVTTWPRAR